MIVTEDIKVLAWARSRLVNYAKLQWRDYRAEEHHFVIAKKLEAVERGKIKRLMIDMPPRHGKTMLASEYFPAWYLGKHPEHYVIAATYSQERAVDETVEVEINTPKTGEAFLKAVVDENPITGLPMKKWWDRLETGAALEFERRLTVGLLQGETIDQLVARVRGTKTNGYNDGILRGGTRHGAEMLVRTAVNRVSNTALNETWKANRDITNKYRYMATLDGRTSQICIALDGKEWEYDAPGSRLPPQHPNCRSVTIPVIDWEGLGVKPRYRPDDSGSPAPGMRASKDGPVSADLTYGGWLKEQPAEFQNDVLGPVRGKLFRDGKIGVNDLVRSDNRAITLAELRQRNIGAPLKVASGGGMESGSGGSRILAFAGSGDEKKALATRLGFGHERAVDTVLTQVNKGIRDNVEYLSLIHPDGHLLIEEKGNREIVVATSIEAWMAQNSWRDFIAVHNHPDSGANSPGDIYALRKLKSMLTIGHNGDIFTMRKGVDREGLLFPHEVYLDAAVELEKLLLESKGKSVEAINRLMEGSFMRKDKKYR